MSGEETIMAVVTFEQMSAVSLSQIREMKALGIKVFSFLLFL
jgi:serine protease AprX